MGPLVWIVGATLAISLTAWVGVLTLFLREDLVDSILLGLVALAAGSLLGGAFLHLLPSALEAARPDQTVTVFIVLLGGFCTFYVLEQFLQWHHHHATTHHHEPVSYLVLVSDALHNFIDGLVIAGAFLVDPGVGVVTTVAIAMHELPQEIGDYGVLRYGGFSRTRALVLNYLTQVTVVLGGVAGYYLADALVGLPPYVLAFAAGNFVYVASADLVPEIKAETDTRRSTIVFLVFLAGILVMLGVRALRPILG